MTLKQQEKLFLSAILTTLDIRAVQRVVTEYNRLKDLPKLKKEMEELSPKLFKSHTSEEFEKLIEEKKDEIEATPARGG